MGLLLWKGRSNCKNASRRPLNTSFRQQRLKVWEPSLSPKNTLPLLVVITCIFIPIGIGLLVSAMNVQALAIKYEECDTLAITEQFTTIPRKLVNYEFKKRLEYEPQWQLIEGLEDQNPVCRLRFQIPNKIKSPIYEYYKLTNYYQNHRIYIDSYDKHQLKGKALDVNKLSKKCDPLRKDHGTGKVIYPCGLVANSMFNDTFGFMLTGVNDTADFHLTNNGTAWSTDKHRYKTTKYNISDIVPPPNWAHLFPDGYNESNVPDLGSWQEFQIWMRNAALPTFYKLVLKNESSTLPKGYYTMDIQLNYPVKSFNGTKSFVLTSNNIVGAKNISLGAIYLIAAAICALFSIILLVHIIFQSKKLDSHAYLSHISSERSQSVLEYNVQNYSKGSSDVVGNHIPNESNPHSNEREIL